MTSHFLATLWLPWEVDLHVFIDKNRSKIATVIIFFQWKLRFWSLQKSTMELFLELFGAYISLWNFILTMKNVIFWTGFKSKNGSEKSSKKSSIVDFCKVQDLSFHWKKNHYHNYLRSFFRTFWKKVSRGSRRLADDYVESQIQNSHWLANGYPIHRRF